MEKKIDRREKYNQTHTRVIRMRLNLKTDADILATLDAKDNVQGYLKRLIREDIKRNEEEE